jgi:hypothetical protein
MKKYVTGELRNGFEVLDPKDRKTILVLSDDLRMSSGIATMTKEFVMGMCHHYNFVQLGSAINHPEKGKELDLSGDTEVKTGVETPYIRVIPWSGYGDPNILRQLLMSFKPSAILHFTDPRYWRWLYDMEAEVRENVPILFYAIWDDLPVPQYNESYYASCDGVYCISKQTYHIVNKCLERGYPEEIVLKNE